MLGWSLNLFRVRGIQLSVHWSFFLLLTWVAYEGWVLGAEADPGSAWLGMAWYVSVFVAFFGCVVLHEFGHSFTAMHYGIGVRRILLMPIGGMAEFESIPREPSRELLITLAGPAVNFVIAGLLWLLVDYSTGPDFPATLTGISQLLLHANLVMGCFNLLPAFPMDGGRILRAALASRFPYLRATEIAAKIGKLVCLAGIGFGIWQAWWMLVVLFTFIFVAGELEYRALRRREIDDARWREMLARFYAPRPPNEPPILSR
jgi:Zn-dependent protease